MTDPPGQFPVFDIEPVLRLACEHGRMQAALFELDHAYRYGVRGHALKQSVLRALVAAGVAAGE